MDLSGKKAVIIGGGGGSAGRSPSLWHAPGLRRLGPGGWAERGYHFAPTIAEIPSPDFLDREVFGSILHIYRCRAGEFEAIAAKLAAVATG